MMTLKSTVLANEFVELTIRGAGVISLKTRVGTVHFMKDLKPEFWQGDTQIKVNRTNAMIAPLERITKH